MLNLSNLKKYLRNDAPLPVYYVLSFVWNIPIKIYQLLKSAKLILFKEEVVKNVRIEDVSFQILLKKSNGLVDKTIYMHGIWEPAITEIIFNKLKSGDVFFDVGANIGYFTLLSARLVGINGVVHSFEPIPRVYYQLSENLKLNNLKNVTAHNFAVGSFENKILINTYDNNIGMSSLLKESGDSAEEVEVKVLDDIFSDTERIDFMKIDVEGFEYEVLKGASKLIKKHKPKILFEINPKRMQLFYKDNNKSFWMLNFLHQQGYTISTIKGDVINDDLESFINRCFEMSAHIELYAECF